MIKVNELKELDKKGEIVTFDVCAHSSIPSLVLLNGKAYGKVHLNTVKSFRKYESTK